MTPGSQLATAAPSMEPQINHEIVGIGSLLFVTIVLITLFSSKLIIIFKFHHLNESIISVMLGILIGIVIHFLPKSSDHLFSFDSEFFFYVLLPPIVFEAGFSLQQKHFMENIITILIFAIIGTMISTLVIAFGLFFLSYLNILPLYNNGNPLECLLFASLISAIDPVGTLSILGKKELNVNKLLYTLIFGESVLNDAVSIVLYKIFRSYNNTQIILSFETHFFDIIGQFFAIFIGSFLIGLLVALCASAILRHFVNKKRDQNQQEIIYLDDYRHNEIESTICGEIPSLEFAIIILFSYLSYNLGEVLSLSGIVSVFSCGICISHYVWYNLSWISQISLHHIIITITRCCENFIYVFLGISCISSQTENGWNILLILFTMLLCLLSRAANIFPLTFLLNVKRRIKISFNMQIMMFFSGLRGAIAFGLALNINTAHSDLIITTTLSVVIVTTILCGATTKYMLDILGLSNDNNSVTSSNESSESILNDDEYHKYESNNTPSLQLDIDENKVSNNEEIEMAMMSSPSMTFGVEGRHGYFRGDFKRRIKNVFNIRKQYHGIHKYWHNFDINYMQKWFGGSSNPYIQHRNIAIYSNKEQVIKAMNDNMNHQRRLSDSQLNDQ